MIMRYIETRMGVRGSMTVVDGGRTTARKQISHGDVSALTELHYPSETEMDNFRRV